MEKFSIMLFTRQNVALIFWDIRIWGLGKQEGGPRETYGIMWAFFFFFFFFLLFYKGRPYGALEPDFLGQRNKGNVKV